MKRFSSPTIVVTLINLILVGALIVTIAHAQDGSSDFPSVQPAAIDSPSSLLFSYQGQLNDSDGNPITDSAVNMTFKLYDVAENGTACWSEEHTGTNAVSVQSGLFNVLLGQITPIDTACLANDVYLELDVNGETMSPRELLTSVAFSAVADDVSAPLDVNGIIKSSGPDGGIFMAKNPSNQHAVVYLNWHDDIARIRVGGTGAGSANGFDIQTQGDRSLMRIFDNGDVHIAGSVSCGAYIESNLQTQQERESETADIFEEGDVLCWSPKSERLEKCSFANDLLVMAVASKDSKPIVMGAESIKVLGPVQAGDILVSSSTPGYAMVFNHPTSGTVIAQALEDFNGKKGVIKAMIRKW